MKIKNQNFSPRTFLVAAAVFAGAAGPAGFAQTAAPSNLGTPTAPANASPGTLAGMNEDIQGLTREVEQLRLEVETLQQSNDDLQKQLLTQHQVENLIQNAVAASHAETQGSITASEGNLHTELTDEMTQMIEKLAKDTNVQLDKLAHAIRAAPLAPITTSAPPSADSAPTHKFDKGIVYIVQKGDTLTVIARKNNSTVADIEEANQITDPGREVRQGRKLFIPQKSGPDSPAPDSAASAGSAPTAAPVTPTQT
jgi:LysM repeat protein